MSTATLKENKMGVMPVGKLLANMALPMIISMLVQALYNIVNSIYVSQISESAVTALSLAFPVQNLQIGFAVGIGVGVNSLLSKSLGQKNQEQANFAAGNGVVLMLLGGIAFFLFGMFGVRPYFEIQSTVYETVEGGIVYTRLNYNCDNIVHAICNTFFCKDTFVGCNSVFESIRTGYGKRIFFFLSTTRNRNFTTDNKYRTDSFRFYGF